MNIFITGIKAVMFYHKALLLSSFPFGRKVHITSEETSRSTPNFVMCIHKNPHTYTFSVLHLHTYFSARLTVTFWLCNISWLHKSLFHIFIEPEFTVTLRSSCFCNTTMGAPYQNSSLLKQLDLAFNLLIKSNPSRQFKQKYHIFVFLCK